MCDQKREEMLLALKDTLERAEYLFKAGTQALDNAKQKLGIIRAQDEAKTIQMALPFDEPFEDVPLAENPTSPFYDGKKRG